MKLSELLLNEARDTIISDKQIINGRINRKFNEVKGDLICFDKGLISLEGLPDRIGGGLYCHTNPNLTKLDGAPRILGEGVDAWDCGITSLEGIGKKFIVEMDGEIWISGNPIKSHMLGLILIKGCFGLRMKEKPLALNEKVIDQLDVIFNKHLYPHKDVLECREELIAAGLKEYAKF